MKAQLLINIRMEECRTAYHVSLSNFIASRRTSLCSVLAIMEAILQQIPRMMLINGCTSPPPKLSLDEEAIQTYWHTATRQTFKWDEWHFMLICQYCRICEISCSHSHSRFQWLKHSSGWAELNTPSWSITTYVSAGIKMYGVCFHYTYVQTLFVFNIAL